MIRKANRRRPELEPLESKLLLSGLSTAMHKGVPALVLSHAHTDNSIAVSGTIKGTFTSGKLPGSPITFNGQGTASPVGHVTFKGSLKITILNPKATATISTSKGKIYLTATERTLGGPVSITIKGGTGIYHAASGTGTGSLKLVNAPGKGPVHGTFTFTFHGTLTT
jgi:hypothetical protein